MRIKPILMGALALGCACALGEPTKEVGVKGGTPGAAAQKLQTCNFLLNKDFKKNAKYYLCLFSASWCGPCRREMPRIAKTYAESLKADPNVELIHFSRDREEDKALAWAKEHDVKFPVVKYNGGNPLDLHTRGIPHLFIVDADGKLIEEGHPVKMFTDEKLKALKTGTSVKPETATEKTRKAIAKLFPGWSLDSEVPQWVRPEHCFGFYDSHRGRNNIIRLHPANMETPVVLSRTVKLSGSNPCLSLSVSSWCDDADFLLSVRVNGKDALTNRLVCTTDAVPWEDIVVPLSPWRGSSVKLEIILSGANRWWCEWSHLARVDIVEADSDMSINEGKFEVAGYTWSYRAQNGEAMIVAENDGRFSAVSPCPVGNITIPATLAGAKVTHIGRDAFLDCSALTSVTIPEGVVRIGRGAFRDCTGLKSITIPSSVKIIEKDAFAGCNALASVSIPDGVKIIDRGAFYWCCGLESIAIPSSVTQIGRDAFFCCRGLTSVTIPENVTDIVPCAFRGCNALTSVEIPASVTNIVGAFCDTGALTSFQVDLGNRFYKSENGLLLTKDGTTLVRGVNGNAVIPPSVTAIGLCAFEGCVALRSAEIPLGVKSIGPYAFKQCRGMTSVTIPSSVTDIGQEAFWGCKNLKSIAIPQGVTVIRNSTFSGSALTGVVIPSNVKVLERGAFSWCGELSSVTFPEGMISIGRDAFYNCGKLMSLTIPSSVRRIEQGAFYGCGSLTSVTMRGERPDAPKNIFERCGKLKSIHVPANAKSWAGMKDWQGIPLVFDAEAAESRWEQSRYMIVDLDKSGKDAVSYLDDVPNGVWGDEYKTNKIVMRRIDPGSFEYLPGKFFKLTKPFYVGVFEVTQKQYEKVMKGNPSEFKGDMRPVESVSYTDIRGANKGLNWPKDNKVDDDSYLGKLRGQTGLEFDLPTEVQWEYACRAGTTGDFNVDGVEMSELGRCEDNGGRSGRHVKVGSFMPNAWGLYDMHGNVYEWCIDCSKDGPVFFDWDTEPKEIETDPKGPADGVLRILRGGSWANGAHHCRSSQRRCNDAGTSRVNYFGFRLACPADGHPMKLFTDEKLRELKSAQGLSDMTYTDNGGLTWSCAENDDGSLTITGVSLPAPSPVTIPTSLKGKNVTRIGDDAFRDNAMIIGVTIPGCIVGIGDRAFAGCANLEELTILEGVKAIGGSDAFRWCPKLKTVTLPKSLTFIRQRVFRNGGGIENVNVDSVESYMSIGFGTGSSTPLCSGKACLCVNGARLVDLIVPVGCRRITASAFNGANGLRSITIPGSVSQIGCCAFDNCSSNVVIRFANDIGALTLERNVAGGAGCPTIEVLSKSGCPFLGWFDKDGNEVKDPFHSPTPIVVTPRWNTKEAFALNAAPGSITELNLGNVPPLQFVYCPAGKFTMGYKEQPALSKVKDVEITSPFWVSKTVIRADQLESLGINFATNSITNGEKREAWISDASIVVQKLPSALEERFGKMLPPGYVFRLPTEAEFEYLQKAETKGGDGQTNIWGVERLYSGGYIGLLDRAPAYGRGVDVVNRRSRAVMTDLNKVNYENQPDKDPVGWSEDPNWSVFRRGLARNCGGGKLITSQGGRFLYGFYFVVAPDVDKLNKFYWK